MMQNYYVIMPMSDRALKYIDKFGSEKLRYQTLTEAVNHYRELKRILVPDIGVAQVTCYSGNELNKVIRNQGLEAVQEYKDDSITDDTEAMTNIDEESEVNEDDY